MKQPKAILISDIHFTPATLELATSALIQAKDKAIALGVPLVLCGDTLDSKAVIRGECANRLLDILNCPSLRVIVLVGNHDLLNEKGKAHSLNFLKPYCEVIDSYTFDEALNIHFIPYQNDSQELLSILKGISTNSFIIAHQGLQTAWLGHYVQDKTSLPPEAFKRFTTVSGHYHRTQIIKCGNSGTFTYVGTPYTISFAEAKDGPKGFQILFNDNSLELVPTNLRKHLILECNYSDLDSTTFNCSPEDLVWLKIKGPYSELKKLKKKTLGERLLGHSNFKLDLVYLDAPKLEIKSESLSNPELLDEIINNLEESHVQKNKLKELWRQLVGN